MFRGWPVDELFSTRTLVIDQYMDQQQLDGGDAGRLRMTDHRGGRSTISAAQASDHVLAFLGQPLDVRLVDDGVLPGDVGVDFRGGPS